MKADAGPDGMFVAGGTDLYPNMKRRHQEPKTVISLMGIPELRRLDGGNVGTCVTLTALSNFPTFQHSAIATAARLVSTPLLRNMGTLGGNLCLDTRCNYYNQSYEWRKSIDFCMKKDGHICWVAPSSPRCWAVSSSDIAPVMVAIGAEYRLAGPQGERLVPAGRFYQNDGINYLTKQPDEIIVDVRLPAGNGWDAAARSIFRCLASRPGYSGKGKRSPLPASCWVASQAIRRRFRKPPLPSREQASPMSPSQRRPTRPTGLQSPWTTPILTCRGASR